MRLLFLSILCAAVATMLLAIDAPLVAAQEPLAISFSHERGYIDGPQTVTITASDPNATILVATHWGHEWLYDDFVAVARPYEGPVEVTGSTQVRALAFTSDQRTDLQSHSYIDISHLSAADQNVLRQYPTVELNGAGLGTRDTEDVTLVEVFWPDGSRRGVAAPAGIRTRRWSGSDGLYRLYFRAEYGLGRLNYELFPDEPEGAQLSGTYDKVNLHAGSQDGIGRGWLDGFEGCSPGPGTLMRDRYFQRLHRAMSGDGPVGQYYSVFHRGEFLAFVNAEDVPHQGFMEEAFGGDDSDYGLWTSYSDELLEGNPYWDDLGRGTAANFYSAMDVANFVDYHLVQWVSGNADWAGLRAGNNVVVGGRLTGPYYHWIWDSHAADPGCDVNWGEFVSDTYTPAVDDDFRMDVADRVLLHFFDGGSLTTDRLLASWDDLAAELAPVIPVVFDKEQAAGWNAAERSMRDRLSVVSDPLFEWLVSVGYYPSMASVSYSMAPGAVASGSVVELSGGPEIYYTLDGTDPRQRGGAVSDAAIRYSEPLTLPEGTVQVMARVRSGRQWSAAYPYLFQVGPEPGLSITETSAEYIEISNLGDATVNLEYFRLQGDVRFKFDYARSPILAPGGSAIVADDAGAFARRYGSAPAGEFVGDFTGGSVTLVDPHLEAVHSVDGYLRVDGLPGSFDREPSVDPSASVGVVLNEWNAVSTESLIGGGDERLGFVVGNGGNWFELVVVEDRLDVRGLQIEVNDVAGANATLHLSDDEMLSDLRAGTIITISAADVVGDDGTIYGEDVSYAPDNGDSWIHLVAGVTGTGAFVSAVDFETSHQDWQLTIASADGSIQWGPVGEGIGSLPDGVNKREVGELEARPRPELDPSTAPYGDSDSSTFGLANRFDGQQQVLPTGTAEASSAPTEAALEPAADALRERIVGAVRRVARELRGAIFAR